MSNSGLVSRVAGDVIGADAFLPNMGTEDFLLCLSRQALEAACTEVSVQPRPKVRETRAALVEHFADARFVHPAARFAPDMDELTRWIASNGDEALVDETDDDQDAVDLTGDEDDAHPDQDQEPYPEAAE